MKTNQKTAAATTANITTEQQQILMLTARHGYTAQQLQLLFMYVGAQQRPELANDIDNLIDDYISQAENIAGAELQALSKLNAFRRMLML